MEESERKVKSEEAEFWHTKSLEIVCKFLPSDCPLVNHILVSYQKHHAPVKTKIIENQEQNSDLEIVKPIDGIEFVKYRPIIRKFDQKQFTLDACSFEPAIDLLPELK